MRWAAEVAGRALVLAALWWVVSEGSPLVGPQFAVLVILAATAASLWVLPPRPRRRPRPAALLRAGTWFLTSCVRAGARVAWLAVRPGPPVTSTVVRHDLRHGDDDLAVLMADVISVLPGTLALRIDQHALHVHVLDGATFDPDELVAAERRLAALYGGTSAPG
ncbi:Na+/H+ antiporter subunit E [Trujillonella humicola]|uniref:Na+/H+ antiporter subunit E n=1 Tax=Trujillonella humicola TaxID=3383699 RepID=UPI0039059430